MNYYERIQKSIHYIENRLDQSLDLKQVSKEAYMSIANFYRLFFSLVGHTVKEYIRLRRMSNAVTEIKTKDEKIINIAMKYGFSNHASFTKSFKQIIGVNPTTFRDRNMEWSFDQINLLDQYYDISENVESLDEYPDIKVLKEIQPMKVAYYCFYGKHPEYQAFKVMNTWLKNSQLDIEKDRIRIFGFNNPSPECITDEVYGYEVWITIPEYLNITDSKVKTKTVQGGLYAVCGVKNLVFNGGESKVITDAWRRLWSWLKVSKYKYGSHQWLEEHLKFDDLCIPSEGMDLYLPIELENV
ncbi:AraC family transcriptional regulator [Haloplasma contractile]|uniref:Arginyl-tRNA synthetase protein n=1 Tax=Haloplasma contractile SSD-17B TaxID=1033810 RepID=U2EEV6_9MOLU|nr:helix-turn-helix domain-containing protein [Haloplasma contractile]ERJ13226.1 arginyl-tRNA synthetase protein [Haloplasma contractile SSD-17B]